MAGEALPESAYVREWCGKMGGQVEAAMPDGTRCDCLLSHYAVEVDFGLKWTEAIGQALHYATMT